MRKFWARTDLGYKEKTQGNCRGKQQNEWYTGHKSVYVITNEEEQRYPYNDTQYYSTHAQRHETRVIERVDFGLACDPRDETANQQQEQFVSK